MEPVEQERFRGGSLLFGHAPGRMLMGRQTAELASKSCHFVYVSFDSFISYWYLLSTVKNNDHE